MQVRARNSQGDGRWSEAGEGTPRTVPGAPRELTAAGSDLASGCGLGGAC